MTPMCLSTMLNYIDSTSNLCISFLDVSRLAPAFVLPRGPADVHTLPLSQHHRTVDPPTARSAPCSSSDTPLNWKLNTCDSPVG